MEPATAAMAKGVQAGRPIAPDRVRDGRPAQVEVVVGGQDDERLGREPELIERSRDREVGLVARVDPRAIEGRPAWRPVQAPHPTKVQVAGQGHAHEVGHDAAAREQAERALAIADEVAQPAHDLLLDERRERAGVPHVDALVRDLGEELTHDRHRQRRWGEVAELARMLGVHQSARESIGEFRDHVGRRRRRERRGTRSGGIGAVVAPARALVRRRVAHGPDHRGAVQEFERGSPGLLAERRQCGPRSTLVAVADQLWFRVPVESREVRIDVGRRGRMLDRRSAGHRARW